MEVYTNSKTIKELISSQTDNEVEPFDNDTPEEVDLFLLDDHLLQLQELMNSYKEENNKTCLQETMLLRRRSDWGGMVVEMIKWNERVYLFDQQWYRIEYNPDSHYFKFKPCDTPNLMAKHSCILSQCSLLLPEEKQAIQALLQPVIFGERLARRMVEANVITRPTLVTQARGDYEKLCLNLEQITLGLEYEKDCWKDEFFLNHFSFRN